MATVDRRTALAGLVGAGASIPFYGAVAAKLGTGLSASPLGGWSTDVDGLPCYVLAGDVPVKTVTPAGRQYPLEPDPLFLLGNYDLTLFAFASGRLQFISGERGWVRMNQPSAVEAGHAATLTVTAGGVTRTHELLGPGGTCASGRTTRRFGCGTARYRMMPEPGLTVERILSVAPSTAKFRAQPAVVLTVRLTNTGAEPLDLDYAETVLSNPTLMANRARGGGSGPVTFVNKARPLPAGRGIICDATATSNNPAVLTAIDVPNQYNLYPPSLALAAAEIAGGAAVEFGQRTIGGAVALSARSRVQLAPGATRDIVLIVALKSQEIELGPLETFVAALAPSSTGDWFRQEWVSALRPLAAVPDPALRAELSWNGHALLAMATYAAYFDETFIPQGMTYDYYIDLNAGPRDHLQHAMAAAYFAPELARSSILYTLRSMTARGWIKFTVSGNGETASSTWNTSDQQLFLFYAIGEYMRITRDWSVLEVETPYLPEADNSKGTVLQKLERAFICLRDRVSTGPHGLVRLLNADWNDQIYAGISSDPYRETAESQMNSAMVMAVIPPLIEQLDEYARTRSSEQAAAIARLTHDMQVYAERISKAMIRDMEGRTYARRVWLAPGKALGEENMHLEPQSFLLQAPGFPVERKRSLLREMQRRLIDGEVLGPRQREKPALGTGLEPGTGENGGFWYSLSGQAIAGVATFDRRAALELLDCMMFRNFIRRHPNYWVGRWTAPDTLNAEICGDIGGLPRTTEDGLWCKMANYCAHAHAWPIYSYFRIRDAA